MEIKNSYEGKVMWSHLDANMHMRHSAYADFAAQARIAVLDSIGMDYKAFQKLKVRQMCYASCHQHGIDSVQVEERCL